MTHCNITLNETLQCHTGCVIVILHYMSNSYVTLIKLSLCDIVIAITSRSNNILKK